MKASYDNPQPKKMKCFCCGSDQCFSEKINNINTLMCFSCGYFRLMNRCLPNDPLAIYPTWVRPTTRDPPATGPKATKGARNASMRIGCAKSYGADWIYKCCALPPGPASENRTRHDAHFQGNSHNDRTRTDSDYYNFFVYTCKYSGGKTFAVGVSDSDLSDNTVPQNSRP